MAKSKLQLREAHGEGRAAAVWDRSGKHLITAGADGRVLVHTWDPSVASAVVTTLKPHNVAATCLSMSPNGSVLATGSMDHSVKLYSYPGGVFQSTVTRFTLPIRSLAFSITGGLLAAAGDDEGIKLITMADNSIARILKGHNSPVTSLAFDPKNEYLASVDGEGTVIFWLISSGKSLHTLHHLAPSVDVDSESSNTVAWHPDGNLLAVPGRKNDVLLLDRDTAEEICSFKGGHTSEICTLAWSINGKYLATVGRDVQIVLWDVEKKEDMDGIMFDYPVCSIAWKPVENALAVVTMEGKFTVWESVIPPHMVSPTIYVKSSHFSATNFEELHKFEDEEGSEGRGRSIELGSQDTDSEDGEKINDGSDEEEEFSAKGLPLNQVYDKKEGKVRAAYSSHQMNMQEAFQPGSTERVEGKRWFLTYNLIGSISSCDKDGSRHIEIDFHDISKGVRIPAMADYFGYTMASLAENGCIFGSSHQDDKNPSTLMYRPFNSWASNSEWSMRFSSNEELKAVAAGDGWSAAATSWNILRTFSESGLQKFILSLRGPVVSMCGYRNQLLVVNHASGPLCSGDQNMEFMVLDMEKQIKTMEGSLPLSPGSTLSWIGFSETGYVGSYDSQGVLRRYCHEFGGSWVPVFRTEKEKKTSSESYWLVGFNDTQAFAVICKLPDTQPMVYPRPILSFFNLSLPLVNADFGGDELENEYLRHSLLLSQARARVANAQGEDLETEEENVLQKEVDHDKSALKLISAACRGDKLARALELANSLQLDKSLEGAIKLVNALRLPALAEQLNLLYEKRHMQKSVEDDVQRINQQKLSDKTSLTHSWKSQVPIEERALQQRQNKTIITEERQSKRQKSESKEEKVLHLSKTIPSVEEQEKVSTDNIEQQKSNIASQPKVSSDEHPVSERKASNPFAKKQSGASASSKSVLDSLKMLQRKPWENTSGGTNLGV